MESMRKEALDWRSSHGGNMRLWASWNFDEVMREEFLWLAKHDFGLGKHRSVESRVFVFSFFFLKDGEAIGDKYAFPELHHLCFCRPTGLRDTRVGDKILWGYRICEAEGDETRRCAWRKGEPLRGTLKSRS